MVETKRHEANDNVVSRYRIDALVGLHVIL